MAATTQRIGFVGVGRMGANMAHHLNDEGYSVSAVYDAQRDIADSLAGELDCQAPRNPGCSYGDLGRRDHCRDR